MLVSVCPHCTPAVALSCNRRLERNEESSLLKPHPQVEVNGLTTTACLLPPPSNAMSVPPTARDECSRAAELAGEPIPVVPRDPASDPDLANTLRLLLAWTFPRNVSYRI